MSSEILFQIITNESHGIIKPATELFAREVATPLPTMMVGDGYRLYAATKDGRLVGAANACVDLTDELGYIRKIAVDMAHRNQGVGSALLGYVIDDIRAAGQTRAAICPTNEDNKRLYERLGFAKDLAEKISPSWMFLGLLQP